MAASYAFHHTDGARIAAPTFLSRRYKWGPTAWPIAWCEAVRATAIDCGVFSAFARAIMKTQGAECYGAQVLQLFGPATTVHWRQRWAEQQRSFNWIDQDLVYHEVVILVTGEEADVFDPTDGHWLSPAVDTGYGAVVAIRSECPRALAWGRHTLSMDQWILMGSGISWGVLAENGSEPKRRGYSGSFGRNRELHSASAAEHCARNWPDILCQ